MSRFDSFMPIILRNENGGTVAGYVNDPYDAGGETICGITKKNHPNLMVWQSLARLQLWQKKKYKPTLQEMAEIYCVYRKLYYDKVRADEIANPALALQVFDCAVNCGVARASKMLQYVVGTTQDGIIGAQTLAKTNNGVNHLIAYIDARVAYYRQIANKGNNARYLRGWINRVNNTHL